MMSDDQGSVSVTRLSATGAGDGKLAPPSRTWRDPRAWVGFAVLAPISWSVAVLAVAVTESRVEAVIFLALPLVAPLGATSERRHQSLISFVAAALPAWTAAGITWCIALLSLGWLPTTAPQHATTQAWWLAGLSSALVAVPFVAAWSARMSWRWLVIGLAISGCFFAFTAALIRSVP
jgi:hypothetical protein